MRWLLCVTHPSRFWVFSIALSSEMKEEEGIAGVTGWRSIIEAKVTVGLKMLPEVSIEDAVCSGGT